MLILNVFSQILSLIDRELFKDLVGKYKSDKHCKGLTAELILSTCYFAIFLQQIQFATSAMVYGVLPAI